MYKVTFYVPESHLDTVKNAMFHRGAGRIGDYDQCCWQTGGQGQYRPLETSDPYHGEQGDLSTVQEFLVEMVCEDAHIKPVIQAMLDAHPYEEPAYAVWPSMSLEEL